MAKNPQKPSALTFAPKKAWYYEAIKKNRGNFFPGPAILLSPALHGIKNRRGTTTDLIILKVFKGHG